MPANVTSTRRSLENTIGVKENTTSAATSKGFTLAFHGRVQGAKTSRMRRKAKMIMINEQSCASHCIS